MEVSFSGSLQMLERVRRRIKQTYIDLDVI